MEKRDYKKEFCALMDKFAFRYSRWQVWNDFLSLSALSLANVMPGPENGEREEQYLSIMDSYQKEDQEAFPKMLGLVVLAGSSLRLTISANLCPSCSLQEMEKQRSWKKKAASA